MRTSKISQKCSHREVSFLLTAFIVVEIEHRGQYDREYDEQLDNVILDVEVGVYAVTCLMERILPLLFTGFLYLRGVFFHRLLLN